MLGRFWHRQFASKLFPALQEKRLLYFANGGNGTDDEGDGMEEQPEEAPEGQPEQPDTDGIEQIAQGVQGQVETISPEIAEHVTDSQFVYEETIAILRDESFADIEGVSDVISEGESFLNLVDMANDPTMSQADRDTARLQAAERKERITGLLESILSNPRIALAVTKAFERRIKSYDALKQELGDTSPAALAALENRLVAENKEKLNFVDQPDLWDEAEVDNTLQELGIQPSIELEAEDQQGTPNGYDREVRNAVRGVLGNTIVQEDDRDADGNPTKYYKLKLLRKKLTAARRLAIMEKNDIGTETTLDSATEIEQALAEHAFKSRKLLETTLQLAAAESRRRWDALRQQLEDKYGSNDIRIIAGGLSVSELALYHRFAEIEHTIQLAQHEAVRRDGTDDPENLPKASDANFVRSAALLVDELHDINWLHSGDEAEVRKGLIGDLTREKKTSEAWAVENAHRLKRAAKRLMRNPQDAANIAELISDGEVVPEHIEEFIDGLDHHADVAIRVRDGKGTQEDLDHLHDNLPSYKQKMLDSILLALSSPAYMRQTRRDKQLLERDSTQNSEEARNGVLRELEAAENALFENGVGSALKHPALDHYVCAALPITEELTSTIVDVQKTVRAAKNVGGQKGAEMIREARLLAAKLTKTVKELDRFVQEGETSRVRSIPPDRIDVYKAAGGMEDTVACYNKRDGLIYLNEKAIAEQAAQQGTSVEQVRSEAIYHEQGHAIVDILMHRIGVLPRLMLATHKILLQDIPGDPGGRTFEDLLQGRAEDWGITDDVRRKVLDHEREKLQITRIKDADDLEEQAQENADDYIREMLMDELANKYATWKHTQSDDGFSQEDLALFALLDAPDKAPPHVHFDTERLSELPGPDIALQMTADDEHGGIGGEEGGTDVVTAPLIGQRIVEAQNQFLLINEFIKNHQNVDGVDQFTQWVKSWEEEFNGSVKKPFYESGKDDIRIPEDELLLKLEAVENTFIGEAKKQMEEVTRMEMEAGEEAGSTGLLGMFRGMELASINDVIGMLKSVGEDLQRMWKRRGERVQSTLGEQLTGWIPDNNIWGLKYAGQLKHEFSRRSNASELEEVKQWKDALEDSDSYALQELLGESKNKDQIRAIVELLIDRGRLDFNDERFWNRLSYLSGMKMPVTACRNNSVLRDKWLQQMVTAIWTDKDKFFDWRQANDNGIESGKKKFTQVADQLSNLSGGLASALSRQLKLWVEAKNSNRPVPDDVNPHLYEEVLHYSMRNGKMSMEEKLFFLVQGTRHGLISIDRLQALAGENGGVLNIFPFIDYFYGKNNTWPEVNALGERLEESRSGDDQFKPGPRTTLWLHMELLRNESARQRISKATSGTRAENIDHEDIPTIVAQADYKTIERLTDIVSGWREKLSPEAAKNTYTGFGTKFKILARLAELDDKGEARFTEADALEAGKSIASYIHMDNIFTRNGNEKATRNEISWGEFETQAPSSAGLRVSAFRNANNSFVKDLLHALGDEIDWQKTGTTAENYVRSKTDTSSKSEDFQKNNFKATNVFAREIAKALSKKENRTILKNILKRYAKEFREENYGDKIGTDMLRQYLSQRRQHQ